MENLELLLWNKTTDELTRLCKVAEIKGRGGNKDIKVKALLEFFSNKNWVKETFDKLSQCDKEKMKCIIQNKYHPETYEIKKIREKYKEKYSYSYSHNYFSDDSKAQLFYLSNSYIPDEFKKQLNELVEPLKMKIEKTDEKIDQEEYFANIINRDERTSDFDEIIKYINTNKIKATKAKGQMPKSSLIKLHEKIGYKDVLKKDEINFNNIRGIEDTIVSNGMINLLENSHIIKVNNGEFCINKISCEEYQKLNKIDKIKFILEKYIDKDSVFINECERIDSNKFYISNKVPKFGMARKMILRYLKISPVNEWIDLGILKKWIRINEYRFLRKYTGEVLIKDKYYNEYYNEPSHKELENSFIDVVFMEYLATMGIVDVVISNNYDEYYQEYLEVDYFRITKFGSYVLDMAKQEKIETKDIDNGFNITDDFRIIINNSIDSLKYELYFDRFLGKISSNPLVYLLDFKGMVKALELGINFKEIYEYIKENCKNEIPLNVKKQFEDWMKNAKKIKLKTVTILELPEEEFEEISEDEDYSGCIDSNRNHVIILKQSKVEEMKNILNKNGKFCI